jgi:hypothetical protein
VSTVEYTINADPQRPILGQPFTVHLSCRARGHEPRAFTFQHRSLVIEIMRDGLGEPRLAFPNRYAIAPGDKLIRRATTGGIEELQPGNERTRSFDLIALFEDAVLAPGVLAVTYRLEEAEPIVRPAPIEVAICSGPAAVPLLIGQLSSDSAAVRLRAAELLGAMTATTHGYDIDADVGARGEAIQRWWSWWHDTGSRLPWNFSSSGATFGLPREPAPRSGLSLNLGGIAYSDRPRAPS